MAPVAALDLRPSPAAPDESEAEFAFLGSALCDNLVVHIDPSPTPEDFTERANGRIWAAIQSLVGVGRTADHITVHAAMVGDPGLESLGGLRFLAEIVDHAPPSSSARDHAAVIIDRARRRRVSSIAAWAQHSLKTGADTAETIEGLESELLAIQRQSGRVVVVSAGSAVRDMLDDLNAPATEQIGVLTGIKALDDHLGPLQPDELILLAARPGMGKSAGGAVISLNIAKAGNGVIEINSEMSVRQMMRRHVSDICHERFGEKAPTYKDIKRRSVTEEQRRMVEWAAGEVSGLPLAMVKKTGLTLSALRSLVRRQTAEWAARGIALGAITVDHVGLLQADGGGRDRYTDQTNIAIGMKALADELHVPVIAMVQLNRKVEDRDNKRPQLSDLRDTGAWEENADTVIGLFRPAYYANKEPEPKDDARPGSLAKWGDWDGRRKSKVIEAILMKVREGEEATIELWASIGHNAIRSQAPDFGGFN